MRDRIYLVGFLLGAGILLYLGRGLLRKSEIVTWGLTFGGTTAVAVLAVTLYRVQHELGASRRELARREAELSFALQVQQALLPRQFPEGEGLEFAAVCVPARGISGDYYDVLRLPDGRLVFTIADVSGKGISAAILMSNVHAVLRVLTASSYSPREVCSKLNRHFYQVAADSRFATLFYGEWNPADRRLSFINAGHNAPLLIGAGRRQRLEAGGPPLGIFPDTDYQVGSLGLEPGDLLVLYSDGITEAGIDRGEAFGESRLEALVVGQREKSLGEIQHQVLAAARAWSRGETEDDMTLLLVRAGEVRREAT
jgi:sigma-B regulation protein RsbU (phosphoserine phosphatase)